MKMRLSWKNFSWVVLTVFLFGWGLAYAAEQKAEEKKERLVWDAGTVQLELEKLAEGVYAYFPTDAKEKNPKGYPVATSGGFVVGDNGVLVVDSMVNKRLADQVMGFVKEVTDKPILYVVNTSYHGDHAYGNYAFPKTARIIQHSKTKAFMDNKEGFEADKKWMAQYFGANRGIEDQIFQTNQPKPMNYVMKRVSR